MSEHRLAEIERKLDALIEASSPRTGPVDGRAADAEACQERVRKAAKELRIP